MLVLPRGPREGLRSGSNHLNQATTHSRTNWAESFDTYCLFTCCTHLNTTPRIYHIYELTENIRHFYTVNISPANPFWLFGRAFLARNKVQWMSTKWWDILTSLIRIHVNISIIYNCILFYRYGNVRLTGKLWTAIVKCWSTKMYSEFISPWGIAIN